MCSHHPILCPEQSGRVPHGRGAGEGTCIFSHGHAQGEQPQGGLAQGVQALAPTDAVALRCPWASPRCGCCGYGTRGAAWSGTGPGVTGGMELGWWEGQSPPALPSHPGLPSSPHWDVLPPGWRDALLVRKEDGEFW